MRKGSSKSRNDYHITCLLIIIKMDQGEYKPDDQLDTGESGLEQLDSLLVRFTLDAHLHFYYFLSLSPSSSSI